MAYIRKGEPYPYTLDRPPPIEHPTPASTDVKAQEARATSPVDASSVILPGHEQHQNNGTAINGTGSQLDKLIPTASPAPILRTIKTLETLFASAPACAASTSTSNAVAPPPTTTSKGLALLDTIFASATPPPGTISAPTPPVAHHVIPELFPPPPSLPPSTRLAYATVHLRSDISSEPESSGPQSPTSCPAAAQLTHSPQPTNSQLPQILT